MMCLPDLTAGYTLVDIYNADETGLYYRALPDHSMVVRDDPQKGIKTSKERVTAVELLCGRRETEAVADWKIDEATLLQSNRQGSTSRHVPC